MEQQQRQTAELAAEQERARQALASCDQMAANPEPGDAAGVPYNELNGLRPAKRRCQVDDGHRAGMRESRVRDDIAGDDGQGSEACGKDAVMKIQGYFTNADEFLGSMSANDWEHVKAVCETNNLDDGSYKVHPTFRALAKVAWWNGTLELLERGPDMYEAGEEAEKYIEAIKALDFNKEYDDLKRSSCRTKRIHIALGPLHTSLIGFS